MPETIRTPVFNRYEVLDKVGSGGMGTVYKARDIHLDRCVALKVLPPGLQEHAESLERFRREAQALASLKHHGIAAVYDADVEGGFPYLVLEFVEGKNLERLLAEGEPLAVPDVLQMGIELAEALDHIHGHRIVHRDVKSSNIIIGPDGRAVLADFGIALVASLPRISRGALGTPEYMSPEQVDGKPLDGRSDLYSLGVVLYECLAGTVPFERAGDSLAELSVLMKDILETPLPSIRKQRAEVPAWLAAVVERCLAKSPDARFASGAELAQALRKGRTSGLLVLPSRTAASPPAPRFGKAALREAAGVPDLGQGHGGLIVIGHTQPVVGVVFSPDGQRLATASGDRAVRLWDIATGQLAHTLPGHEGHILSLAFSPDGHHLASGDVTGSVRVWEAYHGKVRCVLKGHSALVMTLAFSPDGQRLASGCTDGTVRLWDVRRGRLIRTIAGHAGYTLSVAFSPDGGQLASGGADGTIRLWDVATGRLARTLGEFTNRVIAIAFSPDRRHLASSGADGAVRLWDVGAGHVQRVFRGHRGWVMSLSFSPDGKHLASAGRDQAVCVWEVPGGRLLHRLEDHHGEVMSVAYSPAGTYLATGSKDTTVRLRPLQAQGTAHRSRLRRILGMFFLLALAVLMLWGGLKEHGLLGCAARDEALCSGDRIYAERAGWTVIVASRGERTQAERIAARLRDQGFRIGVLVKPDAQSMRYRVGVGQFEKQAEALAVKQRLAGKHKDLPADAWVVQIWPGATP